jgi:hypothetical protein
VKTSILAVITVHLYVFLTKKEICHVAETVSVTLACQVFVKFRMSSVFKKLSDVRFLKIGAAIVILDSCEFLPVVSSIPCPIWAKSSVDLCMMLLSFVKTDGLKLVLYCGHN